VPKGSALRRMAVTFTHDVLLPASAVTAPRAVVVRVNDIYGRSVGGGEEQLAMADGINVVDVIEYNPSAYDADVIAARLAQDRADYLWDVSYIDDGIAIWNAVLARHIQLKGAIGTSSAFCMQQFSERVGAGSVEEGQTTRAAAVVGQWQAVGVMRIVYPQAYATG